MTKCEHYDVVIVGGGPAGLAVGSELATRHKVLILEMKPEITVHKAWYLPRFVFDAGDAQDLLPFTYGQVHRYATKMMGMDATFWPAHLEGGYVYLKEHEILGYWADKVRERGSDIWLDTVYFTHDEMKGNSRGLGSHMEIVTSKGMVTARMLVDASGHASVIHQKYEISDDQQYWWSVVGSINEHPNGLADDMEVGDYLLWGTYKDTNPDTQTTLQGGRPVFEYFTLGENRTFSLVLYLRRGKVPKPVMEAEYEHILRHEERTGAFHDVKILEPKWGWYPSGGLVQQLAEDRVAFIGDAGRWTTPCGWGMGFIVTNYKQYAERLGQKLSDDRLDKKSLLELVQMGVHQRHQLMFDRIGARFLSNAPATAIDKFVKVFGNPEDPDYNPKTQVPFYYCERLWTLTISQAEALELISKLGKMLTKEEALHLLPKDEIPTMFHEALEFGEEFIHSGLGKIFGAKKPTLESGYKFK